MPSAFAIFFQAEDGIRDIGVTGVQTCALPILRSDLHPAHVDDVSPATAEIEVAIIIHPAFVTCPEPAVAKRRSRQRSEERRVGKECRSRSATQQQKKK